MSISATGKKPDVRVAAGHVVIPSASNPADPANVNELAYEMTGRAIARWQEAKRWALMACRVDSGPVSNPWAFLANRQVQEAEAHLIGAILAHDPGIHESELDDCQRYLWKGRGVLFDGQLFAAIPNPDDADEPDDGKKSDRWRMRLTVLDVGRITYLNPCEA